MEELVVILVYLIAIVILLYILGALVFIPITRGILYLLEKMNIPKNYRGVKAFLKKMIVITILVVGLGLIFEIIIGHIWHSVSSYKGEDHYYKGLVHKIIESIMEDSKTNSINGDAGSIGNYIGYLQLLIAVITLGIGALAFLGYLYSQRAAKELKEKQDIMRGHFEEHLHADNGRGKVVYDTQNNLSNTASEEDVQ